MIMSFPDFYNSAREHLSINGTAITASGVLTAGLTYNNLVYLAQRRKITMLDVRCDYLQQLAVIAAQGNIPHQFVQQAYTSAYTTPIRVTAGQLLEATNEEMQLLDSNDMKLLGLLGSRMAAEYGLMNSIAIKLQDPNASQLVTYRELNKLGCAVKKGSSPIFVFTPTQQSYFRRGNALVKVADATKDEQLAILVGDITVDKKVQYMLNQYYDVAQLRMGAHERSRLAELVAPTEVTSDNIIDFAQLLQNEKGAYLVVKENANAAMTERSIYDSQNNIIYLKSQLPETQRAWELTKRVAEAVNEMTSISPQVVKDFEWRLAAVQLSHKWAVRPDTQFMVDVTKAFAAAKPHFERPVEELACATSKLTRFAVSELDRLSPQEQSAEHTVAHGKEQSIGQLENFMQGIQ